MSDRYTRKDAYKAFTRLAAALGKTWSDDYGNLFKGDYYEPDLLEEKLWTRTGNENRAYVGAWTLDHNSVYGGFVIEEIHNDGGGVSQPFGSMRRNAREFCDAVYFAENALRAVSKDQHMQAALKPVFVHVHTKWFGGTHERPPRR
jgi:hypothetical protein